MFPVQLQICFILPYNQIIKRNSQIIKTNNQIFKTTNMWIRLRLTDVGNKIPADPQATVNEMVDQTSRQYIHAKQVVFLSHILYS